MKFGSYKFVMASTPEAVREMLLKKSVEFAGRPQTYSIVTRTLGRYYMFYQYNRTYPEFIHKLLVILLVRGSLILFGKTFFAQCTIGRNTMYVSNWGRNRHFTWPWPSEPLEGLAACGAKGVPSFLSYFKTLSIGPAPRESNPRPPALPVKPCTY